MLFNKVCCSALAALMFLGMMVPSRATAANHNVSELRDLIELAVHTGLPTVVIPPGIYRGGPPPGSAVVVTLSNISNLKIVAKGVFLISTMRTRALEFDNCRNVVVDGLSIDYDPLTFTQGTVTAVSPDKGWIDVDIDAGYSVVPFSRIDVVDPKTSYRKHGMPFLWGTTAAVVGARTVRVTLTGIGSAAPIGSRVSLSSGNDPGGVCHGIDLEYCRGGMILRNVTLYCAPGMGIVEHGGAGGTQLISDRIVPGPIPIGATMPRLLTTSWDGILHSTVGKGPDVENCTIEDCGDDSWSDQSSPLLVVQVNASQVKLAGSTELSPGDRLCQSLISAPLTVESCSTVPIEQSALDPQTIKRLDDAPSWSLWSVEHGTVQVATLSGGAPPTVGTSFYCPDHQGNGFIFRNNYVHSSGRILIKASDGLIQGNTFIDGHNTVVDPEVPNGAAYGISDITFKGNTIIGADNFCNAPWSSQAGAFSAVAGVSADGSHAFAPSGSLARITIEGNQFMHINGACIALAGVSGVTISGNEFINPLVGPVSTSGAAYGIDQNCILFARNCDPFQETDNKFLSPGPFKKAIVDTDASDVVHSGISSRNGP